MGFIVKKFLSGILIIIGMSIYTTILAILLEMTDGYRTVFLMGQYLMHFGIAMLLIGEKEKK